MASQTLRDLIATRDSEFADYQYVASVYRSAADAGAIPEEFQAEYDARKAAVEAIDARILEVDAEEQRNAKLDEVRARLNEGVEVSDSLKVVAEPRTYGEDSPNSYFADLVRSSSMQWKDHSGAVQRLQQHSIEVAVEMERGSEEGKRAKRKLTEAHRSETGSETRAALKAMETRAGMDTTSGSGGSFVTPQYFESDYAPYRQFGRQFADAANKQPLPEYGMTLYLPQVSGPAGVSAQASQNTGITETDPTAGYLSTGLTTNAGQVTISQQLLDRAGPNFQFDKMIFDQLTRAYNLTIDAFVLTQALANAGTISYTGSFANQTFLSKVAGAKAATQDTAGTVMPADHIFMNVDLWEWLTAQVDSYGRPIVSPDYAGAMNAIAAGASGTPNPAAEGDTGYKLLGLPVFEDQNIPKTSSYYNVVVAHMPEVWFWEGDLVPRVIPQTYAQNLSVLLQVYAYAGVIVRYPKAVQTINGAALAAVTF